MKKLHNKVNCLIWGIIIFCFLQPDSLSAQKVKHTDTLVMSQYLARHPQNDTAKVLMLYKTADAYVASPTSSNDLYQLATIYKLKALLLSLQLQWSAGIKMYRKSGNGYPYIVYRSAEAKGLLKQIVSATESLRDEGIKNAIYGDIADIFVGLKETKPAIEYNNKALIFFTGKQDKKKEFYFLNSLIALTVSKSEANNLLSRAISIADTTNDKKLKASYYFAIANSYGKLENTDESLHFFQKAAGLEEQLADHARLTTTFAAIAAIYASKNDYPVALTYYIKTAAESEKRPDEKNDFWNKHSVFYFYQIANMYTYMKQYELAEKYYRLAISKSVTFGDKAETWRSLSGYYLERAEYVKAIEADEKAQEAFGKAGEKVGVGVIYLEMGDINALAGNASAALADYKKSLDTYVSVNNEYFPPIIIRSMGMLYIKLQPQKALEYFNRALKLAATYKGYPYTSEILTSMGAVYFNLHKYTEAITFANTALNDTLNNPQSVGDKATNFRTIGNVIRDAPDTLLINHGINVADRYNVALSYLKRSKKILADTRYEIESRRDESADFSLTYEKVKNYAEAYDNYKQYIVLRDSINNRQTISAFDQRQASVLYSKKTDSVRYLQQLTEGKLKQQQLVLLLDGQKLVAANSEKELQKAQNQKTRADLQANKNKLLASQNAQALQVSELSASRTQSHYFIAGIVALMLLSFFIASNYYNQRKSNKLLASANTQISSEKKRSEDLLLNILPADVAEELKSKGSSEARLFDEVTVLFTDFVNFTHLSELLSPKELVEELNICFKAFDGIMTTHGIEKIKTIGDAYLAVAGLPHADENHALNTVNAAKEIQQFIHDRKAHLGDKTFDVRIGIHSGSVVAGIVGVKKFAYDIWGDTVNTAARMEQNSQPGKINVSEKTYELVKDRFEFTYRGEIEAKNKGALKMYFVS